VLNNQTNISDAARERVMQAIEQLNYQPSKRARALSSGLEAIMVLSRSAKTTVNNPFFADIVQTIAEKAEEENFDVILQTAKNNTDELNKCITKIRDKMIKGIIMLSSPTDEDFFKQLDVFNIPIVVIGKVEGDYHNIYSVDTDNYQDSYRLTKLLIDLGHKDIACLHSPLDYHVSIDRLNGFKKCMEDHDLPLNKGWIMDSGYSVDSGSQAANQLLSLPKRPSAVLATDDLKVIGVFKAATDLNIRIPQELSVVGYSNTSHPPFLTPALTSIEIPVKKLGEVGAHFLFSKIKENEPIPARTIIKTEEIIGESVS
jgi:DNA-binding LacI/PurR family transcriptional regulator